MLLTALCFIWAGMILGISFLETPVKFTAPSVNLAIGLDVGRHVFRVFNKVEIGAALLGCFSLIQYRPERVISMPLGLVMALLALQTLWLLPVLDTRVARILSGDTPPRTFHHVLYIIFELLKVACLLLAGGYCWHLLQR